MNTEIHLNSFIQKVKSQTSHVDWSAVSRGFFRNMLKSKTAISFTSAIRTSKGLLETLIPWVTGWVMRISAKSFSKPVFRPNVH